MKSHKFHGCRRQDVGNGQTQSVQIEEKGVSQSDQFRVCAPMDALVEGGTRVDPVAIGSQVFAVFVIRERSVEF